MLFFSGYWYCFYIICHLEVSGIPRNKGSLTTDRTILISGPGWTNKSVDLTLFSMYQNFTCKQFIILSNIKIYNSGFLIAYHLLEYSRQIYNSLDFKNQKHISGFAKKFLKPRQ